MTRILPEPSMRQAWETDYNGGVVTQKQVVLKNKV